MGPEHRGRVVRADVVEVPAREVGRTAPLTAAAVAFEPAQLALAIGGAHGPEGTSAAGATILARPAVVPLAPVGARTALLLLGRKVVFPPLVPVRGSPPSRRSPERLSSMPCGSRPHGPLCRLATILRPAGAGVFTPYAEHQTTEEARSRPPASGSEPALAYDRQDPDAAPPGGRRRRRRRAASGTRSSSAGSTRPPRRERSTEHGGPPQGAGSRLAAGKPAKRASKPRGRASRRRQRSSSRSAGRREPPFAAASSSESRTSASPSSSVEKFAACANAFSPRTDASSASARRPHARLRRRGAGSDARGRRFTSELMIRISSPDPAGATAP